MFGVNANPHAHAQGWECKTQSVLRLTFGYVAHPVQEEDVIGVLPTSDKVAELKPLSDRVLIKVGGPCINIVVNVGSVTIKVGTLVGSSSCHASRNVWE